jgi:tight adherence protein C
MLPSAAVAAVVPHVPEPVRSAFAEVARRVVDGARFADAIEWLPHDLGPAALPLADSLAAADRDGLPLAPVLDRLAADARHQRRRRTEAAARQLPVRLSLPLVLCTLPSFVLLAVVPLLLAALASLHR